MKTSFILYSALAVLCFGACSEVIVYKPSEVEKAAYSQVYMPRAEREMVSLGISTTGEAETFIYNAYLGGPMDASADIPVTFSVEASKVEEYNKANGTAFKLFPAEGYAFEATTVIKAGARTTGDLEITIKPGEYLDLFESYLLPLTITQAGTKINDQLNTTYLALSVGYARGQVPRELVLSMGANWGRFLTNYAHGSLLTHDHNFDMWAYKPDEEGKFTSPPQNIGRYWVDSESFYYVNDESMVVRNQPYWAGLFRFTIKDDYTLGEYGPWETFWLGDFWNQYTLIPFKEYFLTVDNEGILRRQPTLTSVSVPKVDVGAGFGSYKQILAYQNSLLALEPNGRLWIYPVSDQAVPGGRRQVGDGWDMYEKILVSGDDILALDDQGDVYRYGFNPSGFYPLK